MDFYLVRHGLAEPEAADGRRPLSKRGRREVEQIAAAVAAKGVVVGAIRHSGKQRAKETAEILAGFLRPVGGVRETAGLAPEDDPFIVKVELEAAESSLMLVGHLPHLGRLASLLLSGDPDRVGVDFSPATVVCLSRDNEEWEIVWRLSPET